jgi:hypothetical protein
MPSLNALIENGQVCQCLRAKTMFYRVEGEELDARNDGPFWCALTQSLLGPDGQVADAASCQPGRACCETAGPRRSRGTS